ncbi:MAG: MarR family transcriptional regulator [Myxococcota bacterium]
MKKTNIAVLDNIPEYGSWIEVVKTYNKCQRLLTSRLDALGLSVPRYEVLLAVAREEGLLQRSLARRLFSAKSNVTTLLQRLEEMGLVRREPDPNDARGQRVYLTDEGRQLARRGAKAQASVVLLMMEGISAREIAEFDRINRKAGANLDDALEELDANV